MLPPGALENADNPDLATGQKIITTSCSFILNKLNFVGRGVQRTQNFQDLAHGLFVLGWQCENVLLWAAAGNKGKLSSNCRCISPEIWGRNIEISRASGVIKS